jgi:hypothetical protein
MFVEKKNPILFDSNELMEGEIGSLGVEVPVKVPEALHWVGAYPSALEQMLFFS